VWSMRMHAGPMARLTPYDGVFEFVRPFGAADPLHVGRITTYATRLLARSVDSVREVAVEPSAGMAG
jgi:hypothetical protein